MKRKIHVCPCFSAWLRADSYLIQIIEFYVWASHFRLVFGGTKQFISVSELLHFSLFTHTTGGQISPMPMSTYLEPAGGRNQSPEVPIKPRIPNAQRSDIPVHAPGTWQPSAGRRHLLHVQFHEKLRNMDSKNTVFHFLSNLI